MYKSSSRCFLVSMTTPTPTQERILNIIGVFYFSSQGPSSRTVAHVQEIVLLGSMVPLGRRAQRHRSTQWQSSEVPPQTDETWQCQRTKAPASSHRPTCP